MKTFIGFDRALALTLSAVRPGGTETVPIETAVGRVLAADVFSRVDSPSSTTSRKDGYAVISSNLAAAGRETPVNLSLIGALYAGHSAESPSIASGQAVQVTTGAPLPKGADAVISEEYCRRDGDRLLCFNTAAPGRNILRRGVDVERGDTVFTGGELLSPPAIGLLAAAGHSSIDVHRRPRVTVVATGDEVVAPGMPLEKGQLYASNIMQIKAWLNVFGLDGAIEIVSDCESEIEDVIGLHLDGTDVFLTSGGAWGSEKDLMLKVLQSMDWRGIYHRVRMGPGKPVGFGILAETPFFILPGGPPSNEMAFLQLALPALAKMMGGRTQVFPTIPALLTTDLHGGPDWTNFIHARLSREGGRLTATPIRLDSRLKSMALKNAIAVLPEGIERIRGGETVRTQILSLNRLSE